MHQSLRSDLCWGSSFFQLQVSKNNQPESSENKPPEPKGPRIYVTDEVGGDLSIIDVGTAKLLKTMHLGKRPRGIHLKS